MSRNSAGLGARISLILLVPAYSGCGDASGAGPIDLDTLPRIEAVEELRVGSLMDPEEGFSTIAGVTVDSDGQVYVLEQQERAVRVYDQDGRRIRTIGRAGGGPGEFQSVSGLGLAGDTLWVGDVSASRIHLFTRSGNFLESIRIEPMVLTDGYPENLSVRLAAAALRPDGLISSRPLISIRMTAAGAAGIPTDITFPEVLFDRNGTVVDTVRIIPIITMPRNNTINVANTPVAVPQAGSDDPLILAGYPGVWEIDRRLPTEGDQGMVTVSRTTAASDTIFRTELVYDAAPFSEDDLTELIEPTISMLRTSRDEATATAADRLLRNAVVRPAYRLPVRGARFGEDETLWLSRGTVDGEMVAHVLIDGEGVALGGVYLPRSATIHWSNGDVVWAAQRDEFDVPWLVRYRLELP